MKFLSPACSRIIGFALPVFISFLFFSASAQQMTGKERITYENALQSTKTNTSKLSEDEVRKQMENNGISEPVIDMLLKQRKEYMHKGAQVNWTNVQRNGKPPVVNATCSGMNVSGNNWGAWVGKQGDNSSGPASNITWSGSLIPPTPAGLFGITAGAGIDANTPGPNPGDPTIPVVCPYFGHNGSIVLNSSATINYTCEQLTYPLTVTAQDTNFVFAYALIIEDGGHNSSDQPFVSLKILDSNGNPVSTCTQFTYVGSSTMPGFYDVNGNGTGSNGFPYVDHYKPWTIVGADLHAFIGQTLNVVIVNADCDQGGHFATSYWDFACSMLNSYSYCQGQTTTICAPSDPSVAYTYQWYLNHSPYTGTPSGTAQCITPIVHPGDTFIVDVTPPSNCKFHEVFAPMQIAMFPGFKDSVKCNKAYFYDTTIVSNGSVVSWHWNFPGGSPSTATTQTSTATYPPGTYTVSLIVKSSSGCFTDTVNHVITIPPLPVINAGRDTNTCLGPVQLNATGGVSYAWSPTSGLSNPNISNPVANPSVTTSYIVTGSNGTCTAKDTVKVYAGTPLVINANPISTVCSGNSVTLSASGGTTYSWSPSTGLNNTNTSNPVATPTSTITYTVFGSNSTGCAGTSTITLTVPTPVASISGNTTVCLGNSTTLHASSTPAPTGYSWSPASWLSCTTCANPVVTPTSSNSYSVYVTDIYGCISTATVNLTVGTPPAVVAIGNTTICQGSQETLTANAANGISPYSYYWTPSSGLNNTFIQSPTASPTTTTTYSVIAVDAIGCRSNTSSTTVAIDNVTISAGTNGTMCIGGNIPLSASGAATYSWSPATGLNNPTISNPTASPSVTTTYTVTGYDVLSCPARQIVTVTLTTPPVITTSGNKTICIGDSTHITAFSTPIGVTYSWAPATGLSCTSCSSPYAAPLFSNTYVVTITDIYKCVSTASVSINVGTLPTVSAIASTTICAGDSANLTSSAQNGLPPYSWAWTPPNALNNSASQNPHAGPVTTTPYMVTVTDANGCKASANTTVYVQSVPSISWASWTPSLTCDGYVIPLKANVSWNGQSVYWNFGDGSSTTTYPPNFDAGPHSFPFNGVYNIQVTVFNAPCKSSLDTTLQVSDISQLMTIAPANIFTPNGDGRNDCFHPSITLLNVPTSTTTADSLQNTLTKCTTLEVYDRWGIKMFESTDTQKCWDGKTKSGALANEGTYYYIAKFGDAPPLKGYVELYRKKN